MKSQVKTLTNWHVSQMPDLSKKQERYISGVCGETGFMSTKAFLVDPLSMIFKASSGQLYRLEGPSDSTPACMRYVFNIDVTLKIKDLSSALKRLNRIARKKLDS